MSSGEVLFILAFIVLPTAVLVSSAWAVLFVRRQPERIPEPTDGETIEKGTGTSEQLDVVVDTVVLPTVVRSEAIRTTGQDDMDDEDSAESEWASASEQDTLLAGPDVPEDVPSDRADEEPVAIEGPEQEPVTISEPEDEPEMLQTTDDLNDVVAEVAAHDAYAPDASPVVEADEDTGSDEQIYETTDLPVVERIEKRTADDNAEHKQVESQRDFESDAADEDDDQEPEVTSGPRWRRRKRPAPLRSSDPDAGRARGRSREPQRQVPQLGRTSRRRDGSPRDTQSDSEEDQVDRT